MSQNDRQSERRVIIFISSGCFTVLIGLIIAVTIGTLPDWAESLFSAIAGGIVVKIADCLSALVALSNGRQNEQMADHLNNSMPSNKVIETKVINAPNDPLPVEDHERNERNRE